VWALTRRTSAGGADQRQHGLSDVVRQGRPRLDDTLQRRVGLTL
jgi:hypothetical protein